MHTLYVCTCTLSRKAKKRTQIVWLTMVGVKIASLAMHTAFDNKYFACALTTLIYTHTLTLVSGQVHYACIQWLSDLYLTPCFCTHINWFFAILFTIAVFVEYIFLFSLLVYVLFLTYLHFISCCIPCQSKLTSNLWPLV